MRKIAFVLAAAAALLLSGCDQFVARNFGGDIQVSIPPGTQLVTMTWKESNLWVLYYDPKTGTCTFREDAVGDVLEGTVTIADCNPIALARQVE